MPPYRVHELQDGLSLSHLRLPRRHEVHAFGARSEEPVAVEADDIFTKPSQHGYIRSGEWLGLCLQCRLIHLKLLLVVMQAKWASDPCS